MTTMIDSMPYRGTRDFYPTEYRRKEYIFTTWTATLNSLGFEQYETSLLENAEIYIAKSGEELGGTQLYNFIDKGDRFVALRPEQTPSLARMVANRFGEMRFPLRWFSIPNCFRYERPQKGRLREHWQLNVDIIGLEPGGAELELLSTLGYTYKAFGADKRHFKVMYNHRQVLDEWLAQSGITELELVYKTLDDWYKVDAGEKRRVLAEKLNQKQVDAIFAISEKEGADWQRYLDIAMNKPEIRLLLENLEKIHPTLEFEFTPTIIRGIAYYTGIVFEAFDKNPLNPRALNGGGRYDNLMELFGKQAPAIGFGLGDVTMHEFLDGWNLWPENLGLKQEKIGILPYSEKNLDEIFITLIPRLQSEGKIWDINYEYERNENKRFQTLKKRGCGDIIKVGF